MKIIKTAAYEQHQMFDPEKYPAGPRKPLIDPASVSNAPKISDNLLEDFQYVNLPPEKLLQSHNVEFEEVEFGEDKYFVFDYNGSRYIIASDGQEAEEVNEWISSIDDPFQYVDARDFNEGFWEEAGPQSVLYHGTPKENLKSIMKKGLLMTCETRGLGNRNTGCAVFATYSTDVTSSYGPVILEILIGQMKADGFMPTVQLEEGFDEKEAYEAIAHKLGLDDYLYEISDSSLAEDTIVIFDNIPPKYLKLHEADPRGMRGLEYH